MVLNTLSRMRAFHDALLDVSPRDTLASFRLLSNPRNFARPLAACIDYLESFAFERQWLGTPTVKISTHVTPTMLQARWLAVAPLLNLAAHAVRCPSTCIVLPTEVLFHKEHFIVVRLPHGIQQLMLDHYSNPFEVYWPNDV